MLPCLRIKPTLTWLTLITCSISVAYAQTATENLYFPFPANTTSHFYLGTGIANYGLNITSHRLPMTFGNWYPSYPQLPPPQAQIPAILAPGFEPNNTALQWDITLGYHLSSTPILPTLWQRESVEINYSQFNRATKNFTHYNAADGIDAGASHGVIWQINDSSGPIYDGGALRIVASTIHASVTYKSAELYFKGENRHFPANILSTSRVGLIATTFNQRYLYRVEATTQGHTHNPVLALGNDTLYAQYAGFAFGHQLEVRVAPAFAVFIDGVMQILYVNAGLVANQTPDSLSPSNSVYRDFANNVRVSDYNTSMSYRAKISGGVSFYPGVYNPNSPKITLGVGVDQWGYVPQEISITGPDTPPPHISISSMRNYFAALSIKVPLG